MRISHLVYSNTGGAGTIAISLTNKGNKSNKYLNKIIFTGPKLSQIYKKIKKNKYSYIKTFKGFQFFSWVNVIFRLAKFKSDLVFVHNYMVIPALAYSYVFNKKIIFVDHAAYNIKGYKDILIAKLSKFFSFNIIVLNDDNYKFYRKYDISKNMIHLIHNGIDEKFFKRKKIKRNINKSFKIGMSARLDSFKLQELIIKALSNKELKNFNIIVSFAGDGVKMKYLKDLKEKLKLVDRVKFEGLLDINDLKNWYNELDLYIHASNGEGMSTSILQAMSMELPIAASNVKGIKELFYKYPKIGKMFLNNTSDISKLIKHFYMKQNKLNEFKLSREYIIQNFTDRLMFLNYIKIIKKVS